MEILVVLLLIVLSGQIIIYLKKKNSPYYTHLKRLRKDKKEASQKKNWRVRQIFESELIWLETVLEVKRDTHSMFKSNKSDLSIASSLSKKDIQVPSHWSFNDMYCYPYAQRIVAEYGKVLAENEFEGVYKPVEILPVPEKTVRKSILFILDYLNLEKPKYIINNKKETADKLNAVFAILNQYFVHPSLKELPKSGEDNFIEGMKLKENEIENKDVTDLLLIDWLNEKEWVAKGVQFAKRELYSQAYLSFEQAKKTAPNSAFISSLQGITHLQQGEQQYEEGQIKLAISNMRMAAELNNKEAIKWLEERGLNKEGDLKGVGIQI